MAMVANLFKRSIVAIILAQAVACGAWADGEGSGAGNGGDLIRGAFIVNGEEIVSYLEETPEGRKIVTDHKLDLALLRETLTTKRIKVVKRKAPLVDNTGSVVDALGVPKMIVLDYAEWKPLVVDAHTVIPYHLIFHEMLRSTGRFNDDDFVISKPLFYLNAESIRQRGPSLVKQAEDTPVNVLKSGINYLALTGLESRELADFREHLNDEKVAQYLDLKAGDRARKLCEFSGFDQLISYSYMAVDPAKSPLKVVHAHYAEKPILVPGDYSDYTSYDWIYCYDKPSQGYGCWYRGDDRTGFWDEDAYRVNARMKEGDHKILKTRYFVRLFKQVLCKKSEE